MQAILSRQRINHRPECKKMAVILDNGYSANPAIRLPNHRGQEQDCYLSFEDSMERPRFNSLALRGTPLEELIPSHRG